MDDVEVVLVALFVSVVVLAAAARAINVPYPIVLVIGGAILGLMPWLPTSRSIRISCSCSSCRRCCTGRVLRHLRDCARTYGRSLLSIGLVIATCWWSRGSRTR